MIINRQFIEGVIMYLKKLLTDDSFDHEYYPYNVLIDLGYPQIDFGKITILYGSNGSGKSTLLNLLAKKIDCQRYSSYVENELWVSESSGAPFYLYTNRAVKPIEEASNFINIQFSKEDYLSKKIIVMDDILKSISDEKEYNHHLVNKANSMQEECRQLRKTRYRDVLEGTRIDASRLSDWVSANSKRTSLKRYVEKRIDYIRMYFSYHNSDGEFRRLNSDEFLIKKVYMLHKKNHRLTPKEIVDLALGIKE